MPQHSPNHHGLHEWNIWCISHSVGGSPRNYKISFPRFQNFYKTTLRRQPRMTANIKFRWSETSFEEEHQSCLQLCCTQGAQTRVQKVQEASKLIDGLTQLCVNGNFLSHVIFYWIMIIATGKRSHILDQLIELWPHALFQNMK